MPFQSSVTPRGIQLFICDLQGDCLTTAVIMKESLRNNQVSMIWQCFSYFRKLPSSALNVQRISVTVRWCQKSLSIIHSINH